MLVQMVHIEVKPGHIDEFIAAFRINYEGTRRNEAGNLRFDVLRDPENSHKFIIYEVFRCDDDFKAHRETEHYKECVRRIDPIITGPRSKTYFTAEMADYLP